MGEESFVGPGPKEGYSKAAIGEGVENAVRHGGSEEKEQGASERAVELSEEACAKHGDQRSEHNGMAEAAMTELCGIRDPQTKRHDIQIGKHGCDDPGEQEPPWDDLSAKSKAKS